MMNSIRSAAIMLAALGLAGCYTSDGAFLKSDNAATPLPAGVYSMIRFGGNREPEAVTGEQEVTVLGNSYLITEKGGTTHWNLIPISGDLYVVQSQGPDSKGKYHSFIGSVSHDKKRFCIRTGLELTAGVDEKGTAGGEIANKDVFLNFIKSHINEYLAAPYYACFVPRETGQSLFSYIQ